MARGSIIVDLLLKTGSFETDTARASKSLKQFQKQADELGRAFGVGLGAAAVAGVAAVGALAVAFNKLVGQAGDFKDLEEQTGASAEGLASLSVIAAVAGTSVEDIAGQANKLTKSLTGVDDESKAAGAALTALGIPIADFKKLDPVGQIDALSKAFNGFADGSQKTAVAMALFGKNGASMLNVFKEIESQGGRQIVLTQQQIELADAYSDNQKKLTAELLLYAQAAATEALPAVTGLTAVLVDLAKEFLNADKTAEDLKQNSAVGDWARQAALFVAQFVDSIRGAAQEIRSFVASTQNEFAGLKVAFATVAGGTSGIAQNIVSGTGPLADALRERQKVIADSNKTFADSANFNATKTQDALKKQFDNQKIAAELARDAKNEGGGPQKAALPALAFTGAKTGAGADTASQELKRRLDGQIRLIQDFGRSQADAFDVANQLLDGSYRDAQLSQSDFFAQQKNLRDAALQSQLASIDEEIAAQRKFLSNPLSKPTDRVAAEERIKLAVQQRSDAVVKAANADAIATQSNEQAVRQLRDAYEQLRSQVLQGAGDDSGAALIRNAQQIQRARDLITQAGGDQGVADSLARQLANQTEASRIQKEYNQLLSETGRREQEIFLDAANAGRSELETLAAIRDARKQAIGLLQQQAAAAANLAAVSGTDEDKKRAADLALAVKKASSEIDPVAQRINKTLEDSLSDPLAEFIKGTKSASEAFKDFAANIASEVANMAAKDIAKQIFGGNNGQSGIGGAVSGLFGSGSSSGGSGANWWGQLASFFGGFFAEGGRPPMGKVSIVGENGPEFFVPNTAGTIVPSVREQTVVQRGDMTVQNHFTISGPVDRRTEQQIANAAGRGVQRATVRYS